jgi:CO/xanthine dehydrogenase FAD-binding subunit
LYFRPRTLHEAVDTLAHHGGRILAGGTDFYPSLGEQAPVMPIVDVSAIAELRGVSVLSDYYSIGGLTTWSELLRAPLPTCFDALKAAAREVGSVQIQNRGTIAGNLCNASPAADGVPPLLALDAEVELTSRAGARRLALNDFIVGNRKTTLQPGEMVTRILVPRGLDDASSAFLKLGSRRYLVISIVMVAVVLQLDDGRVTQARIAVGSCSVVARRLFELEQNLVGKTVGTGLGNVIRTDHLSSLSPIDDVRATASYRRDAALTLVKRAIDSCAGGH